MNDTGYSTSRALLGDGDGLVVDLTKITKPVLIDTIDELVQLYFELEEKTKDKTLAFNKTTDYCMRIVDQKEKIELALEYRKMAEATELLANNPDAF